MTMNKRNILTLSATIMLSTIVATAFDIHTKGKLQFRDMKQSFLQSADSALSMRPSRTSIATHQGYMVEVFITVNADCDLQKLEEVGLRDSEVLSEHTIVGSIAASEVEALSSVEGVVKVSLSGTGRLNNDISRSLTHVDEIHDGISGLPQSYTGEGVLVSLYDSGIQPLHINFMNEHKLVDDKVLESRVKAIYNYQASEDDYGNVSITEQAYTSPEEIAQFSTDDTNETHGTHTLGIMTGSYTSKDFTAESQNDFRGMAPDADIFVTCGPIYYTAVAKAINRIINYAEAKEQPVVINLSIGDNVGPHDGTDGFAAFLNECGAKTPIVLSAGNEGNISISINKRFTDDDNEIRTTIVPRNTIRYYLGVDYEACTEMQIWSEDDTPFTLELGLINKITGDIIYTLPYKDDGSVTYIANGVFESVSTVEPNDKFNYYTDSAIGVATGLAEENHRYCASVYYLLKKEMSHIDRHIVPFLIVKGTPGKRVDIYSDGDYNELSSNKISGWDNGSGNGSISNIACGENVISVGAYRSRQMIDSDPIAVGEVCDFSSYGELSDGRILPDILAPGG